VDTAAGANIYKFSPLWMLIYPFVSSYNRGCVVDTGNERDA
jgi:hypothetical protein